MEDVAPATAIIEYSSFVADIDVPSTLGVRPREIEVVNAGAGTKKLAIVGANGVQQTLTVYDGWRKVLYVKTIKSAGTTVSVVQCSG